MNEIKNIVAITGEYEKDGQKKKIYTNIGKLIIKDGKMSIKIDSIPVGWNGRANIYDRKKLDSSIHDQDPSKDLPF